jgi:hypothetical protein
MRQLETNGSGDGIVSRLKETADGLGQLVADHVKLARVELVAEARSYGRGLSALAVAVLLLVVGYVFAWAAAALALSRVVGAPLAFVIVAAPHLLAGIIGCVSAVGKLKRTEILPESGLEAARSLNALIKPLRTP